MPAASQLNVQIPSDTTEALAVQEQIVALMEKHDYSMRDIFAMRLSLEEGITNAIKHGNGGDPNKKVSISADVSDERLRVEVADEGEGFDPKDVPDPTDIDFIDRACGRGLMLMRAYLNSFEYSEGGTKLTMERERNSELPIIDDDDD
ncbi:MAG TPA: ATP-binding protein [Planctomycetes bacterium]|nr:ATP-binding protein [Fuerstiella sp.]HIK91185.1 ATP-binding protein [Planctomycetota bacterium]